MKKLHESLTRRDNRDKSREHAPLVQPEGSVLIDTSDLGPEEVLEHILAVLKKR